MEKSEIEIVEYIKNRFPLPEKFGFGIGDDAAIVKLRGSATLTTDLMIEGVHFDLSYTSLYHLGFKIVSVNVSDIYAMGGDFKGFLLSLGIPETVNERDLNELFDGIKDGLHYYGGYLLGGDLSKSEKLILSGFALGECENPVMRKGAQPGDFIFITSSTGLSSAGFYLLNKLNEEEKAAVKNGRDFHNFTLLNEKIGIPINDLLERHLMPKARKPYEFSKFAKAMMDISDGLLIDLFRLCEESNVGAEIYLEKLPFHPAVVKTAEYLNMEPEKLILSGGEDYELLVVSSNQNLPELGLIPIGKIIHQKGLFIIDPSKGKIPVKPEGWQHF